MVFDWILNGLIGARGGTSGIGRKDRVRLVSARRMDWGILLCQHLDVNVLCCSLLENRSSNCSSTSSTSLLVSSRFMSLDRWAYGSSTVGTILCFLLVRLCINPPVSESLVSTTDPLRLLASVMLTFNKNDMTHATRPLKA